MCAIHVVKTTINHPMFDGLHTPFLVMLGISCFKAFKGQVFHDGGPPYLPLTSPVFPVFTS